MFDPENTLGLVRRWRKRKIKNSKPSISYIKTIIDLLVNKEVSHDKINCLFIYLLDCFSSSM
jgi:hypothetical protein